MTIVRVLLLACTPTDTLRAGHNHTTNFGRHFYLPMLYLEEWADVYVVAEVRKPAGDYLPTSIVTVLPHFGNLYFHAKRARCRNFQPLVTTM